jgi:hypothetical protein
MIEIQNERNNMKKITFIITAIIILSGCVVTPPNGVLLDIEYFKENVIIYDKASNATVTFSTIKGFQKRHGLHKVVLNDNFLRGFINKKTGKKTYQVYNVINYGASGSGSRWKHFNQANYQRFRLGGMKFISATTIKKEEDCTALPLYGKCLYTEHVVFKVDEELLKNIANSYTPRVPTESVWQYKLIPILGQNYEGKLFVAEIRGLLERMDKYINTMTTEQKAMMTQLSARSDFLQVPEPLIKAPSASLVLQVIK